MIKNSLHIALSQQRLITPQLQHSIRLLQLSTADLIQEIQLQLESNPLLEIKELGEEFGAFDDEENDKEQDNFESEEHDEKDSYEQLENNDFPDDTPLDLSLHDVYTAGTQSGTNSDYSMSELPIYQGETTETLQDYLRWQLRLTPFSENDDVIALTIIDAINEQGYLTIPLTDIIDSLGNVDIDLDEVETVLKRIQHFDPLGVGARTLQECLQIQLNQLPNETPALDLAKLIVKQYLSLLAQHDFRALKKQLAIDDDKLKQTISLIKQLIPYPGELIPNTTAEYIVPDVSIKKIGNQWLAFLTQSNIPNLSINQYYATLASTLNKTDNDFIQECLQQAQWLIKSINNRQETLHKVSQFIVDYQQAFFELGEEQMRPMILSDVAQAVGLHESTISRITTQKYLQCTRGIFELKYFFSNKMNKQNQDDTSGVAIRAIIKKMIEEEDRKKPLSDSKIADELVQQGITIARRTVAKYREALTIPPSNLRKQLD